MTQKLVKCGIMGGLVLFIWGMISWTVLPWHSVNMHRFNNEGRVASVIRDNADESGIYVLPNLMGLPRGSDDLKSAEQDMRKGPFMFASVTVEGRNPDMSLSIVESFILNAVSAALVTWLLLHAKPMSYNKKVGFITMVGLIIALSATMSKVIWLGFPLGYSLACLFDIIFGWFFAGLVIAKMAK